MPIETIQVVNKTNRISFTGKGPAPRLVNVRMEQGAQILRIPARSVIKNITFQGGASTLSPWGALRGAVIKLDPKRQNPIVIDGNGFVVPSAHTLMDQGAYKIVKRKKHGGEDFPHQVISGLSSEDLLLAHSGFCHPDELFLEQGTYTNTEFIIEDIPLIKHLVVIDDVLYVNERLLISGRDNNIYTRWKMTPNAVMVQLREGGHLILKP